MYSSSDEDDGPRWLTPEQAKKVEERAKRQAGADEKKDEGQEEQKGEPEPEEHGDEEEEDLNKYGLALELVNAFSTMEIEEMHGPPSRLSVRSIDVGLLHQTAV